MLVMTRAAAALTFALAAAAAGCGGPASFGTPDVLLFTGRGTSSNDVAAVEAVLERAHVSYAIANSKQLNSMSEARLRAYRLVIVPGGNFEEIGRGLSPKAVGTLRAAVRHGVNYLGICAGAFFAGDSPYNGLNLTSGVRFGFYGIEAKGVRKAAVAIAIPGGPVRSHYWEDGPQLSGWGDVVAKYPDGTPAVVEGAAGEGWMILTGIHPEAPESWREGLTFTTPASDDNAYAATIVGAAIARTRLAHY
jgi:glutamine amidotransferase-like uncharacterized protein